MDAWHEIRIIARRCHAKALTDSGGKRDAAALNQAAMLSEDLHLHRFEPGTKVGDGVLGFLDRPALMVNIASSQPKEDETKEEAEEKAKKEAVVIAHELGHFFLHKDPRNEVNILDPGLGGDTVDSGAGVVQGYSPRERKEVQADVFAGEFLCPSDWLREELLAGRRPTGIAKKLGVPTNLVMNQAIRSLLLPELTEPEVDDDDTPMLFKLDASQQEAVGWDDGPLLVDAGPGTGKTRTLVSRIQRLLDKDVPPASILALTFSNKAAEEMRERVSAASEETSIEMWIGTFHAFGLELLQKWPSDIDRTMDVRILDQANSLALLEDNLSRLSLSHYQNLYEPAFDLADILKAISRCKDEMILPDEYETEAKAFLASATPEEQEAAEKAVEVARVYRVYEELLFENDAVDYGDLVMKSAQLLESSPVIRNEYHDLFEHILVDEYQDVNLASARLLRALNSPQSDVWVVADQRQSIYRFRGAEPANVARFEAEFEGSRRTLQYNYRSGQPVVHTFDAFAASMQNVTAGGWIAHRGSVGGVTMTVAANVASEAAAIRDQIEKFRSNGIAYEDQIILGRTHLTLGRVCAELERLGVPLLYMGDLFERSEIRDLLSLVALDAEFGGISLVRVAALPEYSVARSDALKVIRWAAEKEISVFETLNRVTEIEELTERGQTGLSLLGDHLDGMGPRTSPWTLLTTWLFERSNYLQPLLLSNDAKSQQCLIAIYQFLKVCGEHMIVDNPSRKRLVSRIRRIKALSQDKVYRAVSSEASTMDAVRVMTVHGSKGLEFGVVHLPAIATRYMPMSRPWNRCPPPPSLAHLGIQADDHGAEEECLFFVALSRAKDHLSLSRAERYTTKRASPSKFLVPIKGCLLSQQTAKTAAIHTDQEELAPPVPLERYDVRALETYLKCPAQYSYEKIDNLTGSTSDSAYVGFHRCVSRTIGWLEDERQTGRQHDVASAMDHLDTDWKAVGPSRHANESFYRAIAESMITKMASVIENEDVRYERASWDVNIEGKLITVTPDRVFIDSQDIVHVQKVRNSRKTKSEPGKPIYALLRHGAAQRYPEQSVVVETMYPATGEAVPTDPKKDSTHLSNYANAIAGIESGSFPAKPDSRSCSARPCYFICGS